MRVMNKQLSEQPLFLLALYACLLFGCEKNPISTTGEPPAVELTRDAIGREIDQYRLRIRGLYNGSKFDDLEALAHEARVSKALFANGAWKLFSFYDALGCRHDEPESMWELHERIHKGWIAAKPGSITAETAYAQFLVEFAWHARGYGYADTVTPEGWRLFGERLSQARKILERAKTMEPKCPMGAFVQMTLARGQGLSRAEFNQLFEEAKSVEPQFWRHDVARAMYLLPRWHGAPGEWEQAAETEAERRGGLSWESYARVVSFQRGYYKNVFGETKASWARTRDGFDLMRQKYPEALDILSVYCQLACLAGDQAVAQKLFAQLGNRADSGAWTDPAALLRDRKWALGEK